MKKIIVLSCIAIFASVSVFADGNTTPIKPNTTTPINTTETSPKPPVKDVPK